MPEEFWYVLPGLNPIPWTSPSVAIGRGKGGKPYPIVHSAAELKNYKEAVADALRSHYPDAPLIEDEVAVTFYFWRRLDSLDKGKGKRKSRTKEADATNMQKSTEDALQGILFKNDNQVVHAESWIMGQADDVEPMVAIRVVWHPTRPLVHTLHEDVTRAVNQASERNEPDNEHDVPVEDFI